MIATALALATTGLVAFAAGVLAGRVCSSREPPLREAPRPAEACVEEWTAEDVAAFPEARARAYADLAFLDADDEALVDRLVTRAAADELRRPL